MRFLALVVLVACAEKEPAGEVDTLDPVEPADTDVAEDTGDTVEVERPDPAAVPTDIDEDCWAWMATDVGPDGDADYVGLYVYEPEGVLLTGIDIDLDVDGDTDLAWRYEYDAAGLLTAISEDGDGDGAYEIVEHVTYDANGDQARYTLDEGGDGTNEEVWTYTFVDGLRQRIDVDLGDDGTVDDRYDYTYDAADRLLTATGDVGIDGTIDMSVTYTYVEATGPDRTSEADLDGDGEIDERNTSRYDAAGNPLFVDDEDLGLGVGSVTEYTYGADGSLETRAFEYIEDGAPVYDYVETTEWLAPKMTDSVTRVHGLNGFGLGDSARTYTWSCAG